MDRLHVSLLGLGLATEEQGLALSQAFSGLDPDDAAAVMAADAARPGPSTQRLTRSQARRHISRYTQMAEQLRRR